MSRNSTLSDRRERNIGLRRHRRAAPQERREARAAERSDGRSVAWRFLDPGAVVWARVAYREVDDSKVRPVVVVDAGPEGITGYPCTTSPTRFGGRIVATELHDLRAAGLDRATGVIRVPIRLRDADLGTMVGRLSDNDLYNVELQTPSGPVAA